MSEEIILPYGFVPFAEEQINRYHLPYTNQELPHHDKTYPGSLLSGSINYTIDVYSDLAVELRRKTDGEFYLSGSQIRGKVRSNIEQISASYPLFVDRMERRYRIINDSNSTYRKQLLADDGLTEAAGIEEAVGAGYLRRNDDGSYYIIPAIKFGRKNFLSLHEYWLIQQSCGLPKKENQLFVWKNEHIAYFNTRFEQIESLTKVIKKEQQQLGEKWHGIKKRWSNVFLNRFALNKAINWKLKQEIKKQNNKVKFIEQEVSKIATSLTRELSRCANDGSFQKLIESATSRWRVKAELYWYTEIVLTKNKSVKPYQDTNIFFKLSNQESIESISRTLKGDYVKGCLFNSTNAGSKRSHYLIGGPNDEANPIPIPDEVRYDYDSQLKKIRFTRGDQEEQKDHYRLFGEDFKDGQVVFYKSMIRKDNNFSLSIGRTPYLKISYEYQTDDLLGSIPEGRLDYARAMFGFVTQESGTGNADESQHGDSQSYHSRLRFGAAVLKKNMDAEIKSFLLPSPQPTAAGMYIHPGKGQSGKTTYENREGQKQPFLNGQKYYHILKNPIKSTSGQGSAEMKTSKLVLSRKEGDRPEDGCFHGSIHFTNLSPDELGLLILGLNIGELNAIETTGGLKGEQARLIENYYELIGGAKPYGYGKVRFEIEAITMESAGSDFESLLEREKLLSKSEYVDYVERFVTKMEQECSGWVQQILLPYLSSKQERDFSNVKNYANWSDLPVVVSRMKGKSIVGYPSDFYLKLHFDKN